MPSLPPPAPAELYSLRGKVALVTGAAGHLGAAISSALAGAGAYVYLNGRDAEKLSNLCEGIRASGYLCKALPFDITDDTAMKAAVKDIESEHGKLNIVVNNAHSGKTGTLESATAQDYVSATMMAVGAPATLLQAVTPLLAKSSSESASGSVINIASMYGMVSPDPSIYGDTGHNSPPYYAAAKGALLQFTRYAAVHLADRHIRVNSISPGAFPKPRVAETMPDLWKTLNARQPMKRVGRPEELQGAVVFLASGAASYVTGINIPVDGGWTIW